MWRWKSASDVKWYASSASPGRWARVVHERLSQSCGSSARSRSTMVPLPAPPGPEMTMISEASLLRREGVEQRGALLHAEAAHAARLADADRLHRAPGLHLADPRQRL